MCCILAGAACRLVCRNSVELNFVKTGLKCKFGVNPQLFSHELCLYTTRFVQIHTHARFPRRKKWPPYHVAVPTGNALVLHQSVFTENRLKFRPPSAAEVSIVCGTNNHVKSEMLSNRHRHTDQDLVL